MSIEVEAAAADSGQLEIFTKEEVENAALPRVAIACFNRLRPNEIMRAQERGIVPTEAVPGDVCAFIALGGACANTAVAVRGEGGNMIEPASGGTSIVNACGATMWLDKSTIYDDKGETLDVLGAGEQGDCLANEPASSPTLAPGESTTQTCKGCDATATTSRSAASIVVTTNDIRCPKRY